MAYGIDEVNDMRKLYHSIVSFMVDALNCGGLPAPVKLKLSRIVADARVVHGRLLRAASRFDSDVVDRDDLFSLYFGLDDLQRKG